MAHKPQSMSQLYSHSSGELDVRLEEATKVGFGFEVPKAPVVPECTEIAPK
jgi:hypothetical protein